MTPTPLRRVPSVTVVVPCYNYGHYLPACVASALDQPGVASAVIIVDDGSTDDTAAVAERLAADDRVRLVRHSANAGHIATYNDGLARADGDYVVLLSADDRLTPGSLGRATALLDAHPNVGFAYGSPVLVHGDAVSPTLPPASTEVRRWAIWSGAGWLQRRWEAARNPIWSPEVVMRTTLQHELGGYRADFPHAADLEMWMRAAAVADVGYVVGADQAYYRIHDESMHVTSFSGAGLAGILADLRHRRDLFDRLASEGSAHADLAQARRSLAVQALKVVVRRRATMGPDLTEQYMAFAAGTDPAITETAWWRAAKHPRNPLALAPIVVLAARDRIRRQRWEAVGG